MNRILRFRVFVLSLITFPAFQWSAGNDLPALAASALSGEAPAIASLRDASQAGLDALMEAARPMVRELRQGS